MIQQHPHSDVLVPGVRHLELGQVLDHRRIELDLPVVDELHHRRGNEGLAGRAHVEEGRVIDRSAGSAVRHAEALGVDDLAVVQYRDIGTACFAGVDVSPYLVSGDLYGLLVRGTPTGVATARRGSQDQHKDQRDEDQSSQHSHDRESPLVAAVHFIQRRFVTQIT